MGQDGVLLVARWDADGLLVSAHGPLAARLAAAPAAWTDALDLCHQTAARSPAPLATDPESRGAIARTLERFGHAVWPDGRGGLVQAGLDRLASGGLILTVALRTPAGTLGAEMLQEIMDILPATVSVKDADRRYLFVNRSWEAYAGMPAGEVLGRRHEEVAVRTVSDRDRPSHSGDIAGRDGIVLATGQPLMNQEERYLTPGGEERTLLSNKMPLLDAAGRPAGVLSVTVDITDQKRAERLLRTAKEEAEAASLAKSTFLATMSHELRTPLNGILGLNELLLGTELAPQQRQWAEVVQQCATQLASLVTDVLDMARLDTGTMQLALGTVDLVELADDVAARHALAAESRGLALGVEIAPEARRLVRSDPVRLRQILDNLIGNAIKFTTAGAVTLAFGGREEPSGTLRLEASVSDTGIGIAPEALPRVFDLFHQVDGSSTRRHGGAGIGLAMVRRLTELLGGTAAAESTPGEGSVFRIVLPLPVLGARPARPALPERAVAVLGRCPARRQAVAGRLASAGACPLVAESLEAMPAGVEAVVLDGQGLDRDAIAAIAGRTRRLVLLASPGQAAGRQAGRPVVVPWPGAETTLLRGVASVLE